MIEYEVQIPEPIFHQLELIRAYTASVLSMLEAAQKRVNTILDDLESLSTFPERGFNADEKAGRQISNTDKTKGILVGKKKYLAFYTIDEVQDLVLISHLVPVTSDYAKLFLK